MKFNEFEQMSANVNASFNTANFTVLDPVAGDPDTVAVTIKSVCAVTAVGVPMMTPLESNANPVPVNAGADNVTGSRDAADATN